MPEPSRRKEIGRNDPCWCGSGLKYKKCHFDRDAAATSTLVLPGQTPAVNRFVAPPPQATPSASQLLSQAVAHHQADRLHEAELLYRQVLKLRPDDVDALHLLGLIANHAGHFEAALQLIQRAIALKGDFAEAHSNLGNMLRERRRVREAEPHLRRAIELKPELAEAHHNLAIALHELDQPKAAIASSRRAIALKPNYPESLNSLGNALRVIGELEEAEQCYRRAIALRPTYAEPYNGLGIVLQAQLRRDEVEPNFRKALELKPNFAEAHSNMGLLEHSRDRVEEAEQWCRKALTLKPDYPDGYNNLGIVLHARHDYAGAESAYLQALAIKPEFVDAMSNLGGALLAQERIAEAEDWCRKAIAAKPDSAEAYQKYGIVCGDQGRIDEAVSHYRKAIELKPDFALGHWSLSLALLQKGDYAEGWSKYEWRWKCPELVLGKVPYPQPQWDGSSLEGRTLFLHSEQGLGDAIQFVRYAPLAAARGGKVIVACQKPMRSLVQRMPGVAAVWCPGDGPAPECDVQCPLLSLPTVFGTTVETVPADVPYLSPVPAEAAWWRERIGGAAQGKLKVGIAWGGNPEHKNDRFRSCGLKALAPLAAMSSVVAFFSLQKGPAAADAAHPPAGMELIDFTADLNDLSDTAAMMSGLDLVISVDTSVAHLAGATAVPVWTLIAFAADWRWLQHREDTPWYPTMRLFRQAKRNNWSTPIDSVARALAEKASSRN